MFFGPQGSSWGRTGSGGKRAGGGKTGGGDKGEGFWPERKKGREKKQRGGGTRAVT